MSDVDQLLADGLDHYLGGRLELAAAAFHEALRLDPGNAQASEFLAATLGVPTEVAAEPDTFAPLYLGGLTAWDEGPQAKAPMVVDDDPTVSAPVLDHVTQRHTSRTAKLTASTRRQIETLLEEAKKFESLGDFSGASEKAEKVLELSPDEPEALKILDRASATLLQMFQGRLGPLDAVPEVILRADEMIWLSLDHRAGFVLAQIDGIVNYEELYAVCGMASVDTARVLTQLMDQKVIRTKPRGAMKPRLR